jgi:hypothetical protein
MFSNNEAFNKKPKGMTTYVGSAPVKVLAINPSTDQLREIIGESAERLSTNYEATPSTYNNNEFSKPIVFWITDSTDTVAPTRVFFNLVNSPRLSKSASKPQFFNARIGDTYAFFSTVWGFDYTTGQVIENSKGYADNVLSQIRTGEEDYYNFLYVLLKWGDPLTFIDGLKSEKLDFDSVYAGETEGLNNLVNLIKEKDLSMLGIFTVKITEDGAARQSFCKNDDTWFVNNNGKLTEGNLARMKDAAKRGIESSYPITVEQYTFDPLVVYSEDVVEKTAIVETNVDEYFNN